MVKRAMHIGISVMLTMVFSCAKASKSDPLPASKENTESIYANEYGAIHLTPISNSAMKVVFHDNEKIVFDTVMTIMYNSSLLPDDGYPLLSLKTGGIKLHENRLVVYDFGGPTYMAWYARIENIYDRPFYKINDTIQLTNLVTQSKGGEQIEGIYIQPSCGLANEIVHMKGIVRKEKFPRAYYSTPDGPQGMFFDTTQIVYRLVITPHSAEKSEKYNYTGTTINIDGQAAFIWEFADSEAYYLSDHAPWNENELNRKITLEAVLVQFIDGKSVLKNWKIID